MNTKFVFDDEAIITRHLQLSKDGESEGLIERPPVVQGPGSEPPMATQIKEVHLRFAVPRGKASQIMGL